MKRWIQVFGLVLSSLAVDAQTVKAAPHDSMVFTDRHAETDLVNIYPNPVIDVLHIEVHQAGPTKLTVQIKDAIGKTVYNSTAGEVSAGTYLFQVNMPAAAPGLYLYNIIDDKGAQVANGKFVKQ